jgi:CspA family cold shock protein
MARAACPTQADTIETHQITAPVKWYDVSRGFGFLTIDHGPDRGRDIMLHYSLFDDAQQQRLLDGAEVTCRYREGERGLQATEILAIAASADAPISRSKAGAHRGEDCELPADAIPVEVKWYNRIKGFGFATSAAVAGDIFLHAEILRAAMLTAIAPGDRFFACVEPTDRGQAAVMAIAKSWGE